MEHCSEQDDVREREYGEDDEDEVDDDDKELELRRQQHRLAQQHQHQQPKYSPSQNASQLPGHGDEEQEDEDEDARTKQAKKKRPNARTHHSQSSVSSVVSDLALGVSPNTPSRGQEKGLEAKASPSPISQHVSSPPTKVKTSASRSRPRQTSVQATLENVLDQ